MKYYKVQKIIVHNLVFLSLIGLLCGCSHSNTDTETKVAPPKAKKLRALIIGVDGMVPKLVNKFLKEQKMPNLQRIIENGTKITINTRLKLCSPVVWTTIATSVLPEEHGITDFTIDGKPTTSTARKTPAMWNIFDFNNISAATLGWWATWPAENNAGIMISDRAYWGEFPNKVSPKDVINTKAYKINNYLADLSFLPRFTTYPYRPDYRQTLVKGKWPYLLNKLIEDRLVKIYYRDQIYTDIAIELLGKKKNHDVLSIYFEGVDYVQHAFWQFMEPLPFEEGGWNINKKEVEQLQNVIPEYYAYVDKLIGRLLPYCDENTYIYLISDHGFRAGPELRTEIPELGLSGQHDPETFFIISGPEIIKNRPKIKEVYHTDFLPTVLYSLGLPIAKDFVGRPVKEYFTKKFVVGNTPQYIPTYRGKVIKRDGGRSSKQDKEIMENLKSLGYIK